MRNNRTTGRPPLLLIGVLFALAANMLLVTLANLLVGAMGWSLDYEMLATVVAPLLAGLLTALYVRQRAAMHAFLGGLLSVPLLTYIVFNGLWQLGIFAGCFCTLGGALSELAMRWRGRPA